MTKAHQCTTTAASLLHLSRRWPIIHQWTRREWVPLFPCKRRLLMAWRSSNSSIMHFKLCFHHMGNTNSNIILNMCLLYHITSSTLPISLQRQHHNLRICIIRFCSSRIDNNNIRVCSSTFSCLSTSCKIKTQFTQNITSYFRTCYHIAIRFNFFVFLC